MPCPRLHIDYYQKPSFKVIKGGIKVNTDKRLFEGKVASTYTPDWKNIKNSDYGGISDKGGVAKNDTIKLPTNINNVEDIKIDDDDFVITTINEDGTKTETKIPIKDLVPEKDKTDLEQSLTETTQTTTIKDVLGNTFVYSQNPDGTKSITKTKSSEEEENIAAVYETDGHYSTVYLVALMLGMNEEKALELAKATEAPDTTIHSETRFELNDTWIDLKGSQQSIHSLTGGFHGIEELFTAIQFLNTSKDNIKKLGELLHRFGDTYAHSRLDNITPKDLETYNLKRNPDLEKEAIESWKGVKDKDLSNKMGKYMPYFNYYIKKYGTAFLFDEDLQKKSIFHERTLKDVIRDIYSLTGTDKYLMYGKSGLTFDHFKSDGDKADMIYMRPEWYLSYVKNLAWLLAEKYNLDANKLNVKLFEKMVTFAKKEPCSLKGIIDYEIAKLRGKNEVIIPVFHTRSLRAAATIDEVFISDYLQIAKDVVINTKKYMKEVDKAVIVDVSEEIEGNLYFIRVNFGSGFYLTEAYIIKFK